jgi:hypothetical protein
MPGRRNFEKEGCPVLFRSGGKPMELEDARVGMKVLVRSDHREPHRQGAVGTMKKRYGTPEYRVFEVLFPDGQTELFWGHQLEEAREPAHRPKRWWVFW